MPIFYQPVSGGVYFVNTGDIHMEILKDYRLMIYAKIGKKLRKRFSNQKTTRNNIIVQTLLVFKCFSTAYGAGEGHSYIKEAAFIFNFCAE